MAPATKQEALAKLGTLKVGVGYPDKWTDYSNLDIVRGDAYGNVRRAELANYQRNLTKLHGPVDRGEWAMVPQIVNAVNLPLANALNFPAGILQPPYFDPKADNAYNYGSIGATIGHEISHSFDDEGSQFDSRGRLRNWWTPDDAAHFKAAAQKLVKQYDAYCPFSDACVDGQQVLSENIADVAGLSAAYDAYKLSLHGKPDIVKNGLTGDQRFFLAFAQSWRGGRPRRATAPAVEDRRPRPRRISWRYVCVISTPGIRPSRSRRTRSSTSSPTIAFRCGKTVKGNCKGK